MNVQDMENEYTAHRIAKLERTVFSLQEQIKRLAESVFDGDETLAEAIDALRAEWGEQFKA